MSRVFIVIRTITGAKVKFAVSHCQLVWLNPAIQARVTAWEESDDGKKSGSVHPGQPALDMPVTSWFFNLSGLFSAIMLDPTMTKPIRLWCKGMVMRELTDRGRRAPTPSPSLKKFLRVLRESQLDQLATLPDIGD